MIQKLLRKPKANLERMSETGATELPTVVIPASAHTLTGFVDWRIEQDHPKRPRVAFLNGAVWIDMNAEALDSHSRLKACISAVISQLVDAEDIGYFYPDGTLISIPKANVSNEPDACFVSVDSLRRKVVTERLKKGGSQGMSLVGPPDWVLEIVSDSSVYKDTVSLKENYFRAGVHEYWVVDARHEKVDFQILIRGTTGFVPQPRRGGWVTSPLFRRKFSLQRKTFAKDFWRWELQQAPLAKKES
jgi:Uma2 family endonuclease